MMEHTQKIPTIALFILSAAIANAQTLVIDDFDSYTDTTELQANWNSFGNAATSGAPLLAAGQGVDGSNAAAFSLNWFATGASNANMRRINLTSLDLSSYDFLDVNLFVETDTGNDSPTNPTILKIAFQSSDSTIWQTSLSFALEPNLDAYSLLSFELSETAMERVSGSGSFADSIVDITNIRLRFENVEEANVGQTAFVSSIVASTIPEPSTYALGFGLAMAGTVLLWRRKAQ
ncbi:PEP-CTERM sorting domain-containing protein [Cerasicoccus frondis]|uniref:PEP-CTERM sorting domain-containing protein n=1 Tax=Cerasicoccus frondis TaxID=490090 RepID=UPI0028526713|nr:PEP-CTERM sorting domain-containing protein [Cerasicoccus frondis]